MPLDFSSPQVTAAMLTVLLGFLATQVVGRFLDHNYDKNFRELEKNLNLKKLLKETGSEHSMLDGLVNDQLNLYILQQAGTSPAKTMLQKLLLLGFGAATIGGMVFAVTSFIDEHYWWTAICVVGSAIFASYYLNLRSKLSKRKRVVNTKYKAFFEDGVYGGGTTMIDVKQDGTGVDYKAITIVDREKKRAHIYHRTKSSGVLSVASGEDTSLTTSYRYEGSVDYDDEMTHDAKNAIIPASVVRTSGYTFPAATVEIPLIMEPIHQFAKATKMTHRLMKKVVNPDTGELRLRKKTDD